MARILITGANGYLGSHVIAELRAHGHECVGTARQEIPGLVNCDLLETGRLSELVAELDPARIVHCAWETPRTASQYADAAAAERGLAMVENLLSASAAPIVFVSSMTVYGLNRRSDNYREIDAGQPETAYGCAKWAAEQHLAGSGQLGFAARLPGLFGGGRRDGLVWNVASALLKGRSPSLPAAPVLWAGMDVRVAARSLAMLCAAPVEAWTPINIGYREVCSVSRLLALLAELTGRQVDYDVRQPDFAFDLSRAEAMGTVPDQTMRAACRQLLEEAA